MSTLDEILRKNASQDSASHSAKNDPAPSDTSLYTDVAQSTQTGGGYEDLFRKLNPYIPPTAEELEKEKKKQKRNEVFAKIGDGIMALSNLYFTTQGAPDMYDDKNMMSQAAKVRYDKLIKDRNEKNTAYFNGLMKARQADIEDSNRERSWRRQLGLDQDAKNKYNESIQHRNEREKVADDRYAAEQLYKRARDQEADRRWQETFDENKRRSDRSHNFQVKQHNDNVSVHREQNRATAARGVRGKKLGFSDGEGNQVSIYENVWKGSMQQVYDAMLSDLTPTDELEKRSWERGMKKLDTPSKKEDFVKQNWHKSPKASKIMLTLSSIDPATMISEVDNSKGLRWGNSSDNNDEIDW